MHDVQSTAHCHMTDHLISKVKICKRQYEVVKPNG